MVKLTLTEKGDRYREEKWVNKTEIGMKMQALHFIFYLFKSGMRYNAANGNRLNIKFVSLVLQWTEMNSQYNGKEWDIHKYNEY